MILPAENPKPAEIPDAQKSSAIQHNLLLLCTAAAWVNAQVGYYLQESYSPDCFQTVHPWSSALAISALQVGPLCATSKRVGSTGTWEVLQSIQISQGREPLLKDLVEGS